MFQYYASISSSGPVELIAVLKILRLEFIVRSQYRRDFEIEKKYLDLKPIKKIELHTRFYYRQYFFRVTRLPPVGLYKFRIKYLYLYCIYVYL
jgi:hypothetical protein